MECSSETYHSEKEAKHLTNEEISRYSRQLLLPELGVAGQSCLKRCSVLIAGAGGLGCPAAVYLAAAGIGKLGIIDYDVVELNNLHRQVLHVESRIGKSKAQSLSLAIKQLNSSIECIAFDEQLTSKNALAIIQAFDIIVDATDNVPTRYLLNDACVLCKKPLVSGSALRFEGQLTIYNHKDGPCYRCLFPEPPPPEMVTNCSDGGVLGAVPGIIGTLQALEVVKLASGLEASFSQRMLIFDGLSGDFRNIKLRSKKKNCPICGEEPTITQLIDYEQFCRMPATDKGHGISLLSFDERIGSKDYKSLLENKVPHVLVDVREPVELDICKLPECFNIPINKIKDCQYLQKLQSEIDKLEKISDESKVPVIVICRRGNDSQLAVRSLQDYFDTHNVSIKDIRGGLYAWAAEVDPSFPLY